MKTKLKRISIVRCPTLFASILSMLLVATAKAETTSDLNDCKGLKLWPARYFDLDGDGYAVANVDRNWRVCYGDDSQATVPDGYVEKCGDLDDSDPNVHPRRTEVYGNGIDDDCDGRVDGPEFAYHPQGNENTTEGFTMDVLVNDPAIVDAWQNRGPRRFF